jgi:hypothetical protein
MVATVTLEKETTRHHNKYLLGPVPYRTGYTSRRSENTGPGQSIHTSIPVPTFSFLSKIRAFFGFNSKTYRYTIFQVLKCGRKIFS